MNAPEPIAPLAPIDALVVARAPLSQFAPSRTNRTHTADYIQELAASIAQHDVVQPITARPWPASRGQAPAGVLYEIVVGEGRWRGAGVAGKPDIPFFWRELSDLQALELQLIENLKRKDLTAFEEAEGYRRLMKDHDFTAEQIGTQIGKSRSHVYARLKLLDLCAPAFKIVEDKQLDPSVALLIARIPVPDLQVKAAREVTSLGWGGEPVMSYRNAVGHIRRSFMLELKTAPFPRSDAELLPAAGSCLDCPKRTGNAQDLFADVESPDVCTDPACHEAKAAAHVKRQKEAAKAAGLKVIDGKEAQKIIPNSYCNGLQGGLVDLDKEVCVNGKYQTLRKALGKDAPPPEALVVDPHHKGKTIEAVATATVKEKLAAKGITVDGLTRGSKSAKEKEADQKRKQEATYRQRLFERIRSQLTIDFSASDADTNLQTHEYRLVAASLFDRTGFDDQKRIARLWIGQTDEKQDDHSLIHELRKRIDHLERGDCCRLLIELAIVGEATVHSYGQSAKPERMLELARGMDIDAAAIKTGVIAESREKAKKKVQPKTAKSPVSAGAGTAPDPTPAAQAQGNTKAGQARKTPKTAGTKTDPAPASPANEPPAAAKPTEPELADHLIYYNPLNPEQTWSGKGREPAWVKDLYAKGLGLDVREKTESAVKTAGSMGAWPFPPKEEVGAGETTGVE